MEIELRPAWSFNCEECGKENFVSGVVVELSPEEMQELREEHGVSPDEEGEFMQQPTEVVCQFCGEWFEVGEDSC